MIDEQKLLKLIQKNSYPVSYGRNTVEQGMTVCGIMQAVKELIESGDYIPGNTP